MHCLASRTQPAATERPRGPNTPPVRPPHRPRGRLGRVGPAARSWAHRGALVSQQARPAGRPSRPHAPQAPITPGCDHPSPAGANGARAGACGRVTRQRAGGEGTVCCSAMPASWVTQPAGPAESRRTRRARLAGGCRHCCIARAERYPRVERPIKRERGNSFISVRAYHNVYKFHPKTPKCRLCSKETWFADNVDTAGQRAARHLGATTRRPEKSPHVAGWKARARRGQAEDRRPTSAPLNLSTNTSAWCGLKNRHVYCLPRHSTTPLSVTACAHPSGSPRP